MRYFLNSVVYERFLGFKAASQLNAQSLFKYMKEVFTRNKIDLKKCVSQTYDCAKVMSGNCAGVQTLFRKEAPKALYIHCYNHRLNLVIVHVCKTIYPVNNFFNLVEELYKSKTT